MVLLSKLSAAIPNTSQILLGIFTLLVSYFVYNLFFHSLSPLPGPLSARLGLPFWQIYHAYKRDHAWALKRLHDTYGDCVRVGPTSVSITDPEAVKAIYAHGNKYHKTNFYTAFQTSTPNMFSQIDPDKHSARRRLCAHVYSLNSMIKLEEYVNPCVHNLLKIIDSRIEASDNDRASVDMSKFLHFYSMDVIGELGFGHDFDLLRSGTDAENFLDATRTAIAFASVASFIPSPWPKHLTYIGLSILFAKQSPRTIFLRVFKLVSARYAQTSQAGEDGASERQDMLAQFIALKYPGTNTPWSVHEVMNECGNILTAGSDTTAVLLSAFFYFLLKHPRVYEKLQVEIDNAVTEGRLDGGGATYAQAVKLEYFHACIKETLRAIPSAGINLPRYVPEGGLALGKYAIPEGTSVGDSGVFGEDAEVYRPERWLEASDSDKIAMEKSILAFGAGTRVCLGKNIALMETSKVLPTLLWRYSFAFTPRTSLGRKSPHEFARGVSPTGVLSVDEPWQLSSSFLFIISDFWCDVSHRHPNE
ncbi:hypothetical protein BS47DRAFT_1350083 [Hydnum rufescens UP504]|uniref:Cytochrome P450 n=1 Tax=Hydnum rufescens UP504 TaxID=1448309 RepID=A0A9P6AN85_9AGAM|nr:hypothetical protein BS47DRAFT_1350083 [Hydnum rufescens UP504]